MIRDTDFVLDTDALMPSVALDGGAKGLVERDWRQAPLRPYEALQMPLIPRSEWSVRIRQMEESQSALSHIRLRGNFGRPIPSLDQNSGRNDGKWGYCWMHSGTHALMLARAAMGLPYVPLSAFAGAATIKKGRNDGGWGAQGLDWLAERGAPDQRLWPQLSVDLSLGTPECWANAAMHRVAESWADVAAPQYTRNLSFDQLATCLLCRVPCVVDFNWWGHSVCAMDLVEASPGQFGIRIWNSWADSWGDRGMAVLKGSQAIPDGAAALRTATASEE